MKKIVIILLILQILGCSSVKVKKEETKEEKYKIIKGLNLAEAGNLSGALESFKKAYEINPKNVLTVRSIGLAYLKLGDNERGVKYLNEALKIDKDDEKSLYNLAILNYENENYKKAKEYLEGIPVEKINLEIIKAKAYVYYKLTDYKKSYLEFNKLFQKRKKKEIPTETYEVYVDVLKKNKLNNKIYPFLYSIYQRNLNNLGNRLLLVNYLNEIEAYDESIDILKDYGIKNGFNEIILYNLAQCFFKKGDYETSYNYMMLMDDNKKMEMNNLKLMMKIYEARGEEKEFIKLKKIIEKLKGKE
ncbi:MAG: hypothetical protein B6I28_03110 [Fusobacteriia bacterium 4572_132]|nr:MAG: hypothetical protein B6I28_03110 [Fusobacteriia bacterium 4572_132]